MSYDPKPRPVTGGVPPVGVVCPKCGCRIFVTKYTRHRGRATVRVKKCTNKDCGHRIRTVEKVESNAS